MEKKITFLESMRKIAKKCARLFSRISEKISITFKSLVQAENIAYSRTTVTVSMLKFGMSLNDIVVKASSSLLTFIISLQHYRLTTVT
jgi:hypothetical protein